MDELGQVPALRFETSERKFALEEGGKPGLAAKELVEDLPPALREAPEGLDFALEKVCGLLCVGERIVELGRHELFIFQKAVVRVLGEEERRERERVNWLGEFRVVAAGRVLQNFEVEGEDVVAANEFRAFEEFEEACRVRGVEFRGERAEFQGSEIAERFCAGFDLGRFDVDERDGIVCEPARICSSKKMRVK